MVVDAEDSGRNVRDGAALAYKLFVNDWEIVDDESLFGQLQEVPEDGILIAIDVARVEDKDDPTPVLEYPNITAGEDFGIWPRGGKGPISSASRS